MFTFLEAASTASAAGGLAKGAINLYKLGKFNPSSINANGPACNRYLHEQYKKSIRSQMEMPHVFNFELKGILKDNYRPNGTIGNGSTAAAIRHERKFECMVKDKFHSQKGKNYITCLTKWLKNNPAAHRIDRAAAENVLLDLLDSLKD